MFDPTSCTSQVVPTSEPFFANISSERPLIFFFLPRSESAFSSETTRSSAMFFSSFRSANASWLNTKAQSWYRVMPRYLVIVWHQKSLLKKSKWTHWRIPFFQVAPEHRESSSIPHRAPLPGTVWWSPWPNVTEHRWKRTAGISLIMFDTSEM